MAEAHPILSAPLESSEKGAAGLGVLAGFGGLFSATACCVLPLALGALGIGAGGLAAVVPFHWPLTIAALMAVGAGWFLYLRKRQACARDGQCTVAPPSRTTFVLLCLATSFVTISALWGYIEQPLMRALGGA